MIQSPRDKFSFDNPPLIRIAFRELVIYAQRDQNGFVHLSTWAEKQDASAVGRVLQRLANFLYRMGDALHPLRYQGRLRVMQRVAFRDRVADKVAPSPYGCMMNRLPVRMPHGNTSYQRFVLYESLEDRERAPLGDVDINRVPLFPKPLLDLGEVAHISTLDKRHGVPDKK